MFGVDEAGRGPALGSLFVGCVFAPTADVLPDDLRDSKQLSRQRISDIAATLRASDDIAVTTVEVTTAQIDDDQESLTDTTAHAFAEAIMETVPPGCEGWLDACHPDEDVFETMVATELSDADAYALHAEHGADESQPIVSAASIIAKDAREQHVEELADRYGDIGSGYPSDPTTREFLEAYIAEEGTLPDCARESWTTCQDLLDEASQQGLDEY